MLNNRAARLHSKLASPQIHRALVYVWAAMLPVFWLRWLFSGSWVWMLWFGLCINGVIQNYREMKRREPSRSRPKAQPDARLFKH